MDRVAQLRKFIEASPQEPFPRYALALELKARGDQAGATAELQALLAQAPDYLAAYLQLGVLLQTLGRVGEARSALERGQEVARRQGNGHTLSELTSALDTLGSGA
ncbi:MAG TPA: tetratricopeptide repeat protein [Myxococcales bacterium]|jgi:tetratricopeptide (TPR) repeat protein|nr:tetratricopeptide repeat protein [Myxococcales bacterium]